MAEHWIAKMHMKKGAYGHHSVSQMHKDEAKGGVLAKRAHLAETFRNMKRKK